MDANVVYRNFNHKNIFFVQKLYTKNYDDETISVFAYKMKRERDVAFDWS